MIPIATALRRLALALLYGALATVSPLRSQGEVRPSPETSWNQWLGNPERTLTAPAPFAPGPAPVFRERWRRPAGPGYAGLSVHGSSAVSAESDGRQDVVLMLDAHAGAERWRFPLGRTRRRAEGVPPGPLSTPALDDDAVYAQALDGRFVCLEVSTGALRWELSLKRSFGAFEPGYGFASSPLIFDDLVVLLPAGSGASPIAALDRRSGAIRWKTRLASATEYTSATLLRRGTNAVVVAQVGNEFIGVSPDDGRLLWQVPNYGGGLWTPSILSDGRAFVPAAKESAVFRISESGAIPAWTTPTFSGAMGPVVEIHGLLVGHHDRRITAVDAETGLQCWRAEAESDGQLLVLGTRLVFFHDRAGLLEVLDIDRSGPTVRSRQAVLPPGRMETPLAFAHGRLYLRSQGAYLALELEGLP